MRNNGPVTQTEKTFSADTKLISTTDLKGKITYCNQAFESVSGLISLPSRSGLTYALTQ